ncbi:MAG TPA: ABC transporter permease [Candidatus Egerieimonas intestinavium]|uniref:ABC transporter permease n=1 Tax=Candidatus Egerieimonas intestinavium TaxID=2840777 RepID=A0A9D1JGD2_9FIRM|nr:ABC transporter permease [Candidatus Egerieimonas intestinavium]
MEKKKSVDISKYLSKYSLFIILIVMMIICGFANENFLTPSNLMNVAKQQTVIILLALGAMLLISAGCLDLAAGSNLALASVIALYAYKAVPSVLLTFLTAIAVAIVCNMVSGAMVTAFNTPPFIATLSVQLMARGMALYITQGQNQSGLGENLAAVGQESTFGIPNSVYIVVIFILIIVYITKQTRLGRSVFAVGGNEEAANASGISVKAVKMKVYALNGILTGVAATIWMSRVNSAMPNGGLNYEFDAMIATIVGGTSFSGGVGSAVGTVVGAFIVGFLNNIMNLMGIDSYLQQVVRGIIIGGAVIWDLYFKNRRGRKAK